MTVYAIVLVLHSYLRWIVLAAGVAVVVRSVAGWRRASPWAARDEKLHAAFVGCVDLQFLLGLLLYVALSPISSAFLADRAASMKDPVLRFYGVEHILTMVLAVTAIHVGRSRSKKATEPRARHRRVWIGAVIGLVLMLVGIPWPFAKYGRPLLRTEVGDAPAAPPAASDGACPPTYARCAPCHGDKGHGDGLAAVNLNPKPRDFSDPAWAQGRTDADLAAIIRDGGMRHGLSVAMPGHSDLSEAEIEALVGCVRKLQRDGAP